MSMLVLSTLDCEPVPLGLTGGVHVGREYEVEGSEHAEALGPRKSPLGNSLKGWKLEDREKSRCIGFDSLLAKGSLKVSPRPPSTSIGEVSWM
jgi:hypothetical protein